MCYPRSTKLRSSAERRVFGQLKSIRGVSRWLGRTEELGLGKTSPESQWPELRHRGSGLRLHRLGWGVALLRAVRSGAGKKTGAGSRALRKYLKELGLFPRQCGGRTDQWSAQGHDHRRAFVSWLRRKMGKGWVSWRKLYNNPGGAYWGHCLLWSKP